MHFFNIFAIFAVLIAAIYASPVVPGEVPAEVDDLHIQPRVTCDLMGGPWGDRACAAHCILLGYRGGWCDSRKVCNCRR